MSCSIKARLLENGHYLRGVEIKFRRRSETRLNTNGALSLRLIVQGQ